MTIKESLLLMEDLGILNSDEATDICQELRNSEAQVYEDMAEMELFETRLKDEEIIINPVFNKYQGTKVRLYKVTFIVSREETIHECECSCCPRNGEVEEIVLITKTVYLRKV